MSFVTTYKSSCGCVFDIEVASNWENGGIEIDDVCIVSICDKHCPTPLAPDVATPCAKCGLVKNHAVGCPELVLEIRPAGNANR